MRPSLKAKSGFSLVELMVTVAILGTLASLSISRFQKFQARARQVEAKVNLSSIYTLMESHFQQNETYEDGILMAPSLLSGPPFNTPSSCHRSNSYGFQITDCTSV